MDLIKHIIDVEGEYFFRLFIAMLLGGLVGLERQFRGRSAGLRTNILVCMGSAAVIVVFQKLSMSYLTQGADFIRMDPARAAAGIITGIGFLGAGTIIQEKDFVRGLTTAASIWVVASVGITVGLGEYMIAIFLTALVLVTLYILHRVPITEDKYVTLSVVWHGELALINEIEKTLAGEGANVKNRRVSSCPKEKKHEASIKLKMHFNWFEKDKLNALHSDERFDSVSWD